MPNGGSTKPLAISIMSLITADAVGPPPAPGPISMTSPTKSPSMATQLATPSTLAMAVSLGKHCRVHTLLDTALRPQRHTKKLDAIAKFIRRLYVGGGDALNALHIDRVELCFRAEGKAGEQSQLVGGIETANVERWIGFRVALRLRFFEDVGELVSVSLHTREDVVAGPVENTVDAGDIVALQSLADGLDHGNAASNGTFEIQRHTVLLGERRERRPVMGQ